MHICFNMTEYGCILFFTCTCHVYLHDVIAVAAVVVAIGLTGCCYCTAFVVSCGEFWHSKGFPFHSHHSTAIIAVIVNINFYTNIHLNVACIMCILLFRFSFVFSYVVILILFFAACIFFCFPHHFYLIAHTNTHSHTSRTSESIKFVWMCLSCLWQVHLCCCLFIIIVAVAGCCCKRVIYHIVLTDIMPLIDICQRSNINIICVCVHSCSHMYICVFAYKITFVFV